MNYQQMIERIKNNEPFALSRWGDGERDFLLNLTHKPNCDGNNHIQEMGEELLNILNSRPEYYLGLQPLALTMHGEYILNHIYMLGWINADIIHNQSIEHGLDDLLELIDTKESIVVGTEHLKALDVNTRYVTTPEIDSYYEIDRIFSDICEILDTMECGFVCFAVGATTNCIIDRLYKRYGNRHILLDIGSALDPYIGKQTRVYHKSLIVNSKYARKDT